MTGTDFPRSDRLILLPWLAKHVFEKTVISLNQTLFSADPEFTYPLLRTLDSFDRIWVREPASLKWLHDNGVQRARLVADTAFLTDPLDHGSHWKELDGQSYFCVSGSAALGESDLLAFLTSIRSVANRTGLTAVFLASAGSDLKLAPLASATWPDWKFVHVPPNLVYPAVAYLLGRAEFLIGGRYHLSILSAINGTPSVLIETNTHKLDGLTELLSVDWPVRRIVDKQGIVSDAEVLASWTPKERNRLQKVVATIRSDTIAAFEGWHSIRPTSDELISEYSPRGNIRPIDEEHYAEINRSIASTFRYVDGDEITEIIGPPPNLLVQLRPLTVYLRRGVYGDATFRCLRQLIERDIDAAVDQLNSRWLVSICDSYADWGGPIEARNALMISTFLNWERLAATYVRWSSPDRATFRVDGDPIAGNEKLWDGLFTVDIGHGDTVNNLLIRYANCLKETPHLLRIWYGLLARIQNNDSILAALDRQHGHLFEESLDWMSDGRLDGQIPPWRKS